MNDIATTFTCSPEYVRVFELTHGSLVVKWRFTTPDHNYIQSLAKKLVQEARKPFSVKSLVLSKIVPAEYLIQWKQVPTILQLNPNDFEPKYDRVYRGWSANDSVQQRGHHPYYRHGLHVLDKYGNDIRWLGMTNSSSEWSLSRYTL